MEDDGMVDVPTTEETFEMPEMNPAACNTLLKTIGKKYAFRDPIIAVKMTDPFKLNGEDFPAGSFILGLCQPGNRPIGMTDEAFSEIYQPLRKPRTKK